MGVEMVSFDNFGSFGGNNKCIQHLVKRVFQLWLVGVRNVNATNRAYKMKELGF